MNESLRSDSKDLANEIMPYEARATLSCSAASIAAPMIETVCRPNQGEFDPEDDDVSAT